MIIPLGKVVHGEFYTSWCLLPYPGHPDGCPMYGTRDECPPYAPLFEAVVEPPFYLAVQEFDLEGWVKKLQAEHPSRSEAQCRIPYLWQGKVKRELLAEANKFLWTFPGGVILERPEANGVNLFATCRLQGMELEKNPQKVVKVMMIIGRRKRN